MKLFRTLLCLCPLALACAQTPPPEPKVTMSVENPPVAALPNVPPDRVVIEMDGVKVTAKEFQDTVDILPEQYRNAARGPGRKQFAENIVRVRLLVREAKRLKIDEDPKFKAILAFNSENLLASMAIQKLNESAPVDDAAMRKFYEEHRAEYERVHARHILIRMKGSPVAVTPGQNDLTEEEALAKAQDLRKKLLDGAEFAKLAQIESDDTGSKANGGDLGFFRRGQMVPSFEQTAFSLKPGDLSEPVKSLFGFHLIKVEEKDAKSFDELKPELEKRVRPEMANKLVEDLKAKAGVKLDPEYFGLDKAEKK